MDTVEPSTSVILKSGAISPTFGASAHVGTADSTPTAANHLNHRRVMEFPLVGILA